MEIIKLFPQMTVELKKPHPCGTKLFKILRVGSVCRVVCEGCGRDMDIDRLKLEKAIKKTFPVADSTDSSKDCN